MVNQFLVSEATEAGSIFDDLQGSLSTQQGELAFFASELRNVCTASYAFLFCTEPLLLHFSVFRLIFFYLLLTVILLGIVNQRNSISALNK